MKKLLPFLFTIVLLLSACGPSVPASTSTPAFTETPSFTETPVTTNTATPVPPPAEPYANISADKAEFWFPIPDKKEWEWGGTAYMRDIWRVRFGTPEDYADLEIICYEDKPLQTGSFEEMLKICTKQIYEPATNNEYDAGKVVALSYSDGGLLIQMTDPSWLKKLINDKPQLMYFNTTQSTNIIPSKIIPAPLEPYVLIDPNKADFWFQLPNQTEWAWSNPIIGLSYFQSYTWNILFGPYSVSVDCYYTDNSVPIQIGSFDDLLKTCKNGLAELDAKGFYNSLDDGNLITTSSNNSGLLIELTAPKLLEFFNQNQSQPMIFRVTEPFNVTPTYK